MLSTACFSVYLDIFRGIVNIQDNEKLQVPKTDIEY